MSDYLHEVLMLMTVKDRHWSFFLRTGIDTEDSKDELILELDNLSFENTQSKAVEQAFAERGFRVPPNQWHTFIETEKTSFGLRSC